MLNTPSTLRKRPTIGMTPQCEAVYSALKTFSCIHFNQLKYFIPPYLSTHKNYEKTIANYLSHTKLAGMSDDCIFVPEMTAPDENIIDVIWTVIDLFDGNNTDLNTALRTAFKPKYPCNVSVFKDNAIKYNIMTLSSAMDFAKIHAENENFKASENKEGTQYLLVFRNLDLVKEFAKAKPEFPFEVVHLEGNFGERPTIKYYNIEV